MGFACAYLFRYMDIQGCIYIYIYRYAALHIHTYRVYIFINYIYAYHFHVFIYASMFLGLYITNISRNEGCLSKYEGTSFQQRFTARGLCGGRSTQLASSAEGGGTRCQVESVRRYDPSTKKTAAGMLELK